MSSLAASRATSVNPASAATAAVASRRACAVIAARSPQPSVESSESPRTQVIATELAERSEAHSPQRASASDCFSGSEASDSAGSRLSRRPRTAPLRLHRAGALLLFLELAVEPRSRSAEEAAEHGRQRVREGRQPASNLNHGWFIPARERHFAGGSWRAVESGTTLADQAGRTRSSAIPLPSAPP